MRSHKGVIFTILLLICLLLLGGYFITKLSGQSKVTISALDREVLKRTESQLQTLQLRFQQEAAPIIQEHDALVAKYCTQAGLSVGPGGNCSVDLNSGAVTRRDPPKQPTK